MMVLKRPRGSVAESPAALRGRLQRAWDGRVARSIAPPSDSEPDFPVTVNIGRPSVTPDALVRDQARIMEWITSWKEIENSAAITFETVTKRRVGKITLPVHIVFETIEEMADFLGAQAQRELKIARRSVGILEGVDERLRAMAPHWRRLASLSDEEAAGFGRLIETCRDGGTSNLDIRELAIAGLDSKWAETRSSMVREALRHIDCLSEAEGFREQMGFREDDRQEIWMKFHPDDMTMPLGDQEFAMRPSKIQRLPQSIRRVVIVENKATFNSYRPTPGVCLFFGSGNAISGTVGVMRFLRDQEILYWGDLDSFGMKILSRVRRVMTQTRSVLMDGATMQEHRALWTRETDDDRFTGHIGGLTADEEGALTLIRDGGNRLEQERVQPTAEQMVAIGLERIT